MDKEYKRALECRVRDQIREDLKTLIDKEIQDTRVYLLRSLEESDYEDTLKSMKFSGEVFGYQKSKKLIDEYFSESKDIYWDKIK